MSGNLKIRARETVVSICTELDNEKLRQQIDEPVDRDIQKFVYRAEYPIDHHGFHRIIADFVQHIYETALKAPWILSPQGALGEALFLLESHYQGRYSQGYAAARLDANDPVYGGMDVILQRLATIIKTVQREKHIKAIWMKYLDPGDWHLRCMIAQILLEPLQPSLPAQIKRLYAAQMVDDIPGLLARHLGTGNLLQKIAVLNKNSPFLEIQNLMLPLFT